MKDLKFLILSVCILSTVKTFSQGYVSTNSKEAHPSAIFDMSNNNINKGFLPNRVTLGTSLTDTTSPVSNPSEGLIVYNSGLNQLPGYYVFQKGSWRLLATRENSVMNAVYRKPSSSFSISSNYTDISNFTEFFNNSGNDIDLNSDNSTFVIEPGKYVVNLVMNISTEETSATSITNANGHVNTHFYKSRLMSGSNILGEEVLMNEISNTSGSKKHSLSITFSFEVASSTSFKVQLARNGGTFLGPTITLNETFIHIEKSLL